MRGNNRERRHRRRGAGRRRRRPLGDPREDRRRPAAARHRAHVLPRGAEDRARCRRTCACRRRRSGPAHNTHIVHYPLRGWKLFNLVATVIGKHTSGGHNELAMPDEVLPLFSHYCEKPTKLMRTPKEYPALDAAATASRWTTGSRGASRCSATPRTSCCSTWRRARRWRWRTRCAWALAPMPADGDFEKAFLRLSKDSASCARRACRSRPTSWSA